MEKENKVKGYLILAGVGAIIIGAIIYFVYINGYSRAIPGIRSPLQTAVGEQVQTIQKGDYTVSIKYKYSYDIEALVVHTRDYSGSSLDDMLSPKDLALAWGIAAELNDKVDFRWNQGERFYSFYAGEEVLQMAGSVDNITRHSSNNHIIPSNDDIKGKVMRIRRGDHIRLKGYLVNVDAVRTDGYRYHWYSSTVRDDTGHGACEVFYVTEVEWLD